MNSRARIILEAVQPVREYKLTANSGLTESSGPPVTSYQSCHWLSEPLIDCMVKSGVSSPSLTSNCKTTL